MTPFLWGALTAASLTIALLFFRSWRLTRDRLFLFFTAAFVAFALNWLCVALAGDRSEGSYLAYLPRLLGFLLIIVGTVDRNRRIA